MWLWSVGVVRRGRVWRIGVVEIGVRRVGAGVRRAGSRVGRIDEGVGGIGVVFGEYRIDIDPLPVSSSSLIGWARLLLNENNSYIDIEPGQLNYLLKNQIFLN